jgi:hypothetical protein
MTHVAPFLTSLEHAASKASAAGLPMRLVLRDGSTVVGVPERCSQDPASHVARDLRPEELVACPPPPFSIRIAGIDIFGGQVREFTLARPWSALDAPVDHAARSLSPERLG